jgi:hypothetical protein
MSKCIRCGQENINAGRICPSCLSNWCDMRTEVFNALQLKYGKLSPSNHQFFIKETKRLEKIWRMDKNKFASEIELINP